MISVILVNYNTKVLTKQAVDSVINSFKSNDYEIIIVDNASTDGSKEFFENLDITNYRYIYNKENLGFGRANNIGFKHSQGEYIYILNSDTLLRTKEIGAIIKTKFKKYDNSEYINSNPYITHDITLPKIKKNQNINCTNQECSSITENKECDITYIKYDMENMKYIYICNHCGKKWKNN